MGKPKALLPWGGGLLFEASLTPLCADCGETLVAGNADWLYELPRRFPELRVIPDRAPGLGPLGGLQTALFAARYPVVAATGCDFPFVEAGFFRYLLTLLNEADAVIPVHQGRRYPLPGIYRRDLLPLLDRLIDAGILSMNALLDRIRVRFASGGEMLAAGFHPERLLFNVNTPKEYALACRLREVKAGDAP